MSARKTTRPANRLFTSESATGSTSEPNTDKEKARMVEHALRDETWCPTGEHWTTSPVTWNYFDTPEVYGRGCMDCCEDWLDPEHQNFKRWISDRRIKLKPKGEQ